MVLSELKRRQGQNGATTEATTAPQQRCPRSSHPRCSMAHIQTTLGSSALAADTIHIFGFLTRRILGNAILCARAGERVHQGWAEGQGPPQGLQR